MDEKEAELLDHCLTGIMEVTPLIAVLENVYGLMTVWPEARIQSFTHKSESINA